MAHRATRVAPLWGAAVLLAWACARAPVEAPVPATPPSPHEVAPAPPCERITLILVHKSTRRLRAYCEGGAVVEMIAAMGRGEGPKRARGDARTPEGRYKINGPPRRSRFYRFLPIDYPGLADAEIARITGRLSKADYQRIIGAHARGMPPPADTALGGQLGFHGEGKRWRGDSRDLDWTYGCVGLADADIDFLAARSVIGTPVVIGP
jgi:murein L,D-transpeptidase YafK